MNRKTLPRGRNGGRKSLAPNRKPVQANILVPKEELDAFVTLVQIPADRNRLVASWMRAYSIAGGESDRLFAQSPTIGKVLSHLEATDAPDWLIDEVFDLIVRQAYSEIEIEKGIKVGDCYIV